MDYFKNDWIIMNCRNSEYIVFNSFNLPERSPVLVGHGSEQG